MCFKLKPNISQKTLTINLITTITPTLSLTFFLSLTLTLKVTLTLTLTFFLKLTLPWIQKETLTLLLHRNVNVFSDQILPVIAPFEKRSWLERVASHFVDMT